MNPGIDAVCHNLEVGSTLCLGTEGEDCSTTHVVESGDSCQGLQSTYGINSTILYSNNPQLDADCNNLYTGEVRRALTLHRLPYKLMCASISGRLCRQLCHRSCCYPCSRGD